MIQYFFSNQNYIPIINDATGLDNKIVRINQSELKDKIIELKPFYKRYILKIAKEIEGLNDNPDDHESNEFKEMLENIKKDNETTSLYTKYIQNDGNQSIIMKYIHDFKIIATSILMKISVI